MRRIAPILPILLLAGTACRPAQSGEHAQPTSTDTVALAQAEFDPAAFDTVKWASDSLRLARGADVFKWACSECHGPQGHGDGGKVSPQGDTLRPPDFHARDWRLASDTTEVERKVFTGNVRGMPHWGLRRMEFRDVDAVAHYILTSLHPAK